MVQVEMKSPVTLNNLYYVVFACLTWDSLQSVHSCRNMRPHVVVGINCVLTYGDTPQGGKMRSRPQIACRGYCV